MPACRICDINIKGFEKAQKCFACGNKDHAKCLKIEESDLKILCKYGNFRYLCNECLILEGTSKIDVLKESVVKCLNHIENKIEHNNQILNQVKETLPSESSTKNDSYSNVVSKSKSTVILQPKDTKELTLSQVDPVKLNLDVACVKPGRNGSIIISCNDTADSNKIKNLVGKKLTDYNVKNLPSLKPRIRISGIDKDIPDEEVVDYIVGENRSLFSTEYICVLKKYLPLRNNNKRMQAIVEVDLGSYSNITNAGKLLVGYDYCKVLGRD
ncbi:hypothetical protein Zmor_004704 [Zophobas morio]|uniref:Zinc finger PHD-type domain-containing protein n=1 Tax=Zophobas morio TaxID=2755281 RepID=A0AA38MLK0_9CUCU|nr:hypothetical protein Zmor_004704 [Zophobas morio]